MAHHDCPIAGCAAKGLPSYILMCPYHWRQVPRNIKSAVHAQWNGGKPTGAYLATRALAIASVEGKKDNG